MKSETIDTSLRRVRANILGNAFQFLVSAGIGVWMTPYLIAHLGVATYGLVPLATNITSYLAIITVALSGSVGRFLTVDIARADTEGAVRTFNTSLFATLALALGLLPVLALLAWFAPAVLDVPPGNESGTRWLIAAAGVSFISNTVASNFAASTFARNRLDLQRLVDVVGNVTQAVCIVLLFFVYDAALWHVGLAVVAMAVVRQVGYTALWRRLTPELRIDRSEFDAGKLRDVLSMGGWLSMSRMGALLFVKAELLVVNIVLGAEAAGWYAPLLQCSMLLRALGGVVAGVLTPTYIAHHVSGSTKRLVSLSHGAVKALGLTMALPIGLMAGLSEPLLRLWLGEEFASLWPLLCVVTLPLSINVAVTPVFGIHQALNRVVWPGAVTLALGIVNVVLAVWLAGRGGFGLYGVAVAGAVVLSLKNVLFGPVYAAYIVGCPLLTFLRGIGLSFVSTIIVAVCGRAAVVTFDLSSWPALALAGLLIGIVYGTAAYLVGFSRAERDAFRRLVGFRRQEAG